MDFLPRLRCDLAFYTDPPQKAMNKQAALLKAVVFCSFVQDEF